MSIKQIRPKTLETVEQENVYRLFYPQVPVVICSKFQEQISAMPANSCIPVSTNPPMVATAIFRKSTTLKIIVKSRRFSINWLNFKGSQKGTTATMIIHRLSQPRTKRTLQVENKLEFLGIDYFLDKGDVPILCESVAYAVCKTRETLLTGDHELIIASVTFARASRDFTRTSYWEFKDYKPVLYLGSAKKEGAYTTLT